MFSQKQFNLISMIQSMKGELGLLNVTKRGELQQTFVSIYPGAVSLIKHKSKRHYSEIQMITYSDAKF